MFKKFRIQSDADPVITEAWRNFINYLHDDGKALTFEQVNCDLIDFNAVLLEELDDKFPFSIKYPILTFTDNIGFTEFILRFS